jgi:hypothetical protein
VVCLTYNGAPVYIPNPSTTLYILAPGARLRPLFRSSASGTHDLKFDEEMGPEMKPSEKALRASKALAELNKGDDKLTRKSEEQVNKVGNKVHVNCKQNLFEPQKI